MLCNVEIQVNNPGAVDDTMDAGAEFIFEDRVINSIENRKLDYNKKLIIKAEQVGTVKKINLRENQYVGRGDLLVELQNEDLIFEKAQTDLKIENLQHQLNSIGK